jgi:hypothetical protein
MHDVAELSSCAEKKKSETLGISLQRNKSKTPNQINRQTKTKKRKMITDRWKSSTIVSKDQKKENATFPVIFIKKKKKRKIVPDNN